MAIKKKTVGVVLKQSAYNKLAVIAEELNHGPCKMARLIVEKYLKDQEARMSNESETSKAS